MTHDNSQLNTQSPISPPATQPLSQPTPNFTQIPTHPTPNNNSLKLIIAALVIIVISLAALLAYLLTQNSITNTVSLNSEPSITPTTIATPTTILQPTTTPAVPADWKTYTDTKYQYSFKYPESWVNQTVANDKNLGNFALSSSDGEKIYGTIFTGTPNVEQDIKNNGSTKSFIINAQKYLLVSYVECDGPGCNLGRKQLDIFTQILSTFKFTDQKATPPKIETKTLNSDQFGFSLQYPSDWTYYKNGNNNELKLPYVKSLSSQNETIAKSNGCTIHFGFGGASGPSENIQSQTVTLGSISYNKKTWLINDKPVFASYFTEGLNSNTKKYEVLFTWLSSDNSDICQKEINQILSTFQFTN